MTEHRRPVDASGTSSRPSTVARSCARVAGVRAFAAPMAAMPAPSPCSSSPESCLSVVTRRYSLSGRACERCEAGDDSRPPVLVHLGRALSVGPQPIPSTMFELGSGEGVFVEKPHFDFGGDGPSKSDMKAILARRITTRPPQRGRAYVTAPVPGPTGPGGPGECTRMSRWPSADNHRASSGGWSTTKGKPSPTR